MAEVSTFSFGELSYHIRFWGPHPQGYGHSGTGGCDLTVEVAVPGCSPVCLLRIGAKQVADGSWEVNCGPLSRKFDGPIDHCWKPDLKTVMHGMAYEMIKGCLAALKRQLGYISPVRDDE
jgi:hypothetical protein